jgi:hypothetical protein
MNTVQTHIQALSEALGRSPTMDAKTRDSLASLQHEIERHLEAQNAGTLTERLEKLAVRFEADHPAVGNALRQAIDALVKAGM